MHDLRHRLARKFQETLIFAYAVRTACSFLPFLPNIPRSDVYFSACPACNLRKTFVYRMISNADHAHRFSPLSSVTGGNKVRDGTDDRHPGWSSDFDIRTADVSHAGKGVHDVVAVDVFTRVVAA